MHDKEKNLIKASQSLKIEKKLNFQKKSKLSWEGGAGAKHAIVLKIIKCLLS